MVLPPVDAAAPHHSSGDYASRQAQWLCWFVQRRLKCSDPEFHFHATVKPLSCVTTAVGRGSAGPPLHYPPTKPLQKVAEYEGQ